VLECGLGSHESGKGPVAGAGSCKHGNASLGSMKDGEFLDKLSDC
jgi:hypothetical protein